MKPGTKPQGKVKIKWSPNFAYAIGLIATDGCIYGGRHISFVSKDLEQIRNLQKCLGIAVKVSYKKNGSGKLCPHIQFGDVLFCKFLIDIGITPAKSKTMGKIDVPSTYFFDFLRGLYDGDGTFYSYYDPRWKNSFMFYLEFISASDKHIKWLRAELEKRLGVLGHISQDGKRSTRQLKYAKRESEKIIKQIYKNTKGLYLKRKKLKIAKALGIMGITLR